MSAPAQLPSIGRIIHYVLRDGRHAGEARAAVVTNAFGGARCNGTVFLDKLNDEGSTDCFDSADFDDSDKPVPGTWHWPPRV